jgi:hypothetical protein
MISMLGDELISSELLTPLHFLDTELLTPLHFLNTEIKDKQLMKHTAT